MKNSQKRAALQTYNLRFGFDAYMGSKLNRLGNFNVNVNTNLTDCGKPCY